MLKKSGFSPDYLWIETGYKDLENLKVLNVQVVPYKSYGQVSFKLVVVYEKEVPELEPKGRKVLAIDYGISNFVTCVIEGNPISYIIDGRGLKTLLRKKLKKIVNLQSKLDNLKNKGLPAIALEETSHTLEERKELAKRLYTQGKQSYKGTCSFKLKKSLNMYTLKSKRKGGSIFYKGRYYDNNKHTKHSGISYKTSGEGKGKRAFETLSSKTV